MYDREMKTAIVIAATLLALGCRAPAPQNTSADATTSTPAVPNTGILPGVGAHHHPIATTNPDAQTFFDQGMALVFGFNHEEATRSFQRAAELDPRAPMPHWGIAWSVGPNYNLDIDDPRAKRAFEAIDTATKLSVNGSPVERDYVAAMAVRYSSDPKADRAALARRYSQAMADLVRRYPEDLDAATLYAESLMNLRPWKLWTLDGKPAEDTPRILAVLESVMKRAPNHMGANHYYIHAVEASTSPERALPSAARLETLAPAAGHLVHMPAHVYARTGDHAAAARANLAGANADRAYLKELPPDTFYGMAYYSHNLHFLTDSHMMQGRFAEAQQAAAELSNRLLPHADMMPMIESMAVSPLNVLMRFGRHEEILKQAGPAGNRPVMVAWWHFARGVAHARMQRVEEAEKERAQLGEAAARIPDAALFGGTGLESARTVVTIAGTVLDARIAEARRQNDAAIAAWTNATAAVDRLPYDEPPVWFYPVRESLGAALLRAGRSADAERVFRDDLVRHPRNPRSLLGLHQALVQQKKDADAAWIDTQFREAWKNADSKVTVDDL
jgi:tetratricopeptide (TPR) repeat protein